jgi:hypothetical protein
MTEAEYITATNLAKVSAAIKILGSVLNSKEYGINEQKLADAFNSLDAVEIKLRNCVKIKRE